MIGRSPLARSHGGNGRFPPWTPLPKPVRTRGTVLGRARHVGRDGNLTTRLELGP
jgi:hypothetical protein